MEDILTLSKHQARSSRQGWQDKVNGGVSCNTWHASTRQRENANGQCNRIYLHSLPVKEYQIIDFFLPKLKDEVMKIKPVQKQTRAGQRTRFKAYVFTHTTTTTFTL